MSCLLSHLKRKNASFFCKNFEKAKHKKSASAALKGNIFYGYERAR